MKIGFDISTILNHGTDIGSGRYMFNLLKNLLVIDKKNEYIFTARYITDDYLHLVSELKNTGNGQISFKLFKTTQKKLDLWNKVHFPPLEMVGFKADIFHCPDFLIPPTLNRKIILTINDLAFMRFPHFNFDWFVKKYSNEVRKNARKAKKIIAISESTKKDIEEFFNIKKDKVLVTHLAASSIFKKLDPGDIDRSVLKKYNIGPCYLLSVGTIEPRKNYVTLIKTYNLIRQQHPDLNCQLVIIGRTGWKSEAAYEEFNNSSYKNDIIFAGRVPDNELVHIYNCAKLFVYPSTFEGFGLPVVEAMQCGLAVTASNSSSMPEILDYKQTLFNPADQDDIAEKILKILRDEKFREDLSLKSLKNAKKFSWETTARKTLEIYNTCYYGK